MILHVARREVLEHARSPRFVVLCLLAITLMPLVACVAARAYDTRARWAASLETAVEIARLNDASEGAQLATRFGWRSDRTQVDPALRAVRAPSPGSVIAMGYDGALPNYWQFSTEGPAGGPAALDEAGLAQSAVADLALVVELVLGLLAILLTADTVSGERESGVLRAVLAHPVSRIDLVLGKYVGAAFSLAVPLALGSGISLVVLMVVGFPVVAADVWPRMLLFALTAGAYLATLLALGLCASVVCRRARTSQVVSLVSWVTLCFAVPHASQTVAGALRPVRPAEIVRLDRVEGIRALERMRARLLGETWRATSGSMLPPADGIVSADVKRRYRASSDPIERDLTSRKRALLRESADAERRARDGQERLALLVGSVSPTVTFRVAAAAAAGTGAPYRDAWEQAVARHQRALELATFDHAFGLEIFSPALRNMRVVIWPDPTDPGDRVPPYLDLPPFAPVPSSFVADGRAAVPGVALLLVEATLLLAFACGAFLWTDLV